MPEEVVWVRAFLGMGGNTGDVLGGFRFVVSHLRSHKSVRVLGVSSAYRTAAMTLDPLDKQADYWNAVCMVETVLTPEEVLDEALWCEQQWGRQRRTKWGSRTLDVDILLYGDKNVQTPRVTVPHPGWKDRIFVLAPLAQLQERVCVEGEWFDVRKMLHKHASYSGGILEIADGGF